MGEDNLETIEKWKNYEFILDNFSIYVYPRIGSDGGKHKNHLHVTFVNAPYIGISATMIRNGLAEGKTMHYFVHPKVAQFIDEMRLYSKKKSL